MLNENDLWLLSYYRQSEIAGALFFGHLARTFKPGPIQRDMTQHFADEAQHANLWGQCIDRLGAKPLQMQSHYQDRYVEAVGLPANVMEVLAITQVFERRVINQYARHARVAHIDPHIHATLETIKIDEQWHIRWIKDALKSLEPEYGADHITATLKRFRQADREIYQKTLGEHAERITYLEKSAALLI